MRVVLTPEDLKSGELVEVGWHPVEIIDYDEKGASDKAKNPGSTNCIWTFKILDGPSKDITVTNLINEGPKSMGHKSNQSFWSTLGFPKIPHASGGFGYDLSSDLFRKTVGFKMMAYLKRKKGDQGGEFNSMEDFKPMA